MEKCYDLKRLENYGTGDGGVVWGAVTCVTPRWFRPSYVLRAAPVYSQRFFSDRQSRTEPATLGMERGLKVATRPVA